MWPVLWTTIFWSEVVQILSASITMSIFGRNHDPKGLLDLTAHGHVLEAGEGDTFDNPVLSLPHPPMTQGPSLRCPELQSEQIRRTARGEGQKARVLWVKAELPNVDCRVRSSKLSFPLCSWCRCWHTIVWGAEMAATSCSTPHRNLKIPNTYQQPEEII